jgi:threonine/homoserine/homoserine lactone efflux protein
VFAAAVLVLNATPGVDVLLTISRTLQGGWRAGVAAVAGINAGCVLHALAAAFGLAALLAVQPALFMALQWAGAAYLVWLGLGLLRQAARRAGESQASVPAGVAARRWQADVRSGFLTNVLNPKVALFFLAFLPQFVPADSPDKTVSFLLLGAWFVLQSSLFSLALVAAVAHVGRMGRSRVTPALQRSLQGLGGLLFVGLALRLLRERPAGA